VEIEWNQSMVQFDFWIIPKGAKNYDNAVRFIEFASRPEQQAKFAQMQLYGPTNKKAFNLISPERARLLPGNPAIADKEFWMDYDFWAATDATGKTNIEKNIELWNSWIKQ
jgi:putative spermidine/putrescine transport system substrate-binding protein